MRDLLGRFPSRCGFTLLDMMIVVMVLAIVSVLALPSVSSNEPIRLLSAGTILASDLEFAQSESLRFPNDLTVVRIDPVGNRYWLARASDTEVPIAQPELAPTATGAPPYEVRWGVGENRFLAGVRIEMDGGGPGTIQFDEFGRLSQTADARIRLMNGSGQLFVSVSATTGTVSIVNN